MKIIVEYAPPTVPSTRFDYRAFVDGQEESGIMGFGRTEKEAVQDLMCRLSDDEEDDVASLFEQMGLQEIEMLKIMESI